MWLKLQALLLRQTLKILYSQRLLPDLERWRKMLKKVGTEKWSLNGGGSIYRI